MLRRKKGDFLRQTAREWPTGIKKTKQREAVLAVLSDAEQPMSAPDIHLAIERMGRWVSLSTVYRVLEIFIRASLIQKVTVANGDRTLFTLCNQHLLQYAVCVQCHKVIPVECCTVDLPTPQLQREGFQITGQSLEITGYCRDCAGKNGLSRH